MEGGEGVEGRGEGGEGEGGGERERRELRQNCSETCKGNDVIVRHHNMLASHSHSLHSNSCHFRSKVHSCVEMITVQWTLERTWN